jgi:hypothetical protein
MANDKHVALLKKGVDAWNAWRHENPKIRPELTDADLSRATRSYSVGGRELVDGYRADEMSSSGRGQILIPWPNRLQDGSYEFDGRRHQLPLNEPERRNAIHGLVRWATWSAVEQEPHRAVMKHVLYPQSGYPFTLGISVEYALSDNGLQVRTTATRSRNLWAIWQEPGRERSRHHRCEVGRVLQISKSRQSEAQIRTNCPPMVIGAP